MQLGHHALLRRFPPDDECSIAPAIAPGQIVSGIIDSEKTWKDAGWFGEWFHIPPDESPGRLAAVVPA